MKKLFLLTLIFSLVLMSCQGGHKTRKCNGKRGIKTPMGLM